MWSICSSEWVAYSVRLLIITLNASHGDITGSDCTAEVQVESMPIHELMYVLAGHCLGGVMAVLAAYDIADLVRWGSLTEL